MAKKDPMDMPVEERLKTLFQLQTTLSGIDEKRALRGELPLEVQDLEDEIEGLTTRMDKINADIAEFEQAVTLKKGEIETAKASVERYKAQLNDVKNNREYDTLSKEIEYQTLEIELCNKKIKEAAARIEEKKQELVERFRLDPGPDWVRNCAWAGLLIAVVLIPMLVFTGMPNMFFGFDSSETAEVMDMTRKAMAVGGAYISLKTFENTQVVIAHIRSRKPQQVRVPVHRRNNAGKRQQEKCIFVGILPRIHEILTLIGSDSF